MELNFLCKNLGEIMAIGSNLTFLAFFMILVCPCSKCALLDGKLSSSGHAFHSWPSFPHSFGMWLHVTLGADSSSLQSASVGAPDSGLMLPAAEFATCCFFLQPHTPGKPRSSSLLITQDSAMSDFSSP